MQIQISWLLKKPTDLDLHCLQRAYPGSAGQGLNSKVPSIAPNKALFLIKKLLIFFLCSHENICCVYSLEAPFYSAPASPIQRGRLPLLPFSAAPLPFLSYPLLYFNSRHKTLHFGENFMKIGTKLKLSMFKGQFMCILFLRYMYCGTRLYFETCLDIKHII